MFRSKDAAAAGVTWRDLYRLRDAGEILALSRGLLQLAEAAGSGHLDFVVACARAPQGMICLASAVLYWGLGDQIPPVVHLAVPAHPMPQPVHVNDEDSGELFWITDQFGTLDSARLDCMLE